MDSFIKKVLINLEENAYNVEDVCFILPSKRAGVFLKDELSTIINRPIFSPSILSIEDFVEELSGLQNLTNTELLFNFYNTYKLLTHTNEVESFESFSKWAQILLQDFNEIDRYLVPQENLFNYLGAIKEITHWSLKKEQTTLVKNHIKFWKRLALYYKEFTSSLINNNKGYQGLIYREATDNIEAYIENNSNKFHVFVGFNALNDCESQIIQALLENDMAAVYWDIDHAFMSETIHAANTFIKQYKHNWSYYKNHAFNWVANHYKTAKAIHVTGVPKFVGQAKYVGQLLKQIQAKQKNLSKVAVILGEERLLIPVLNALPKTITSVNVTMGFQLKHVPLASCFEYLFSIHKTNQTTFYYKDVIAILSHPSILSLFDAHNNNVSSQIISHIQTNNIAYIKLEDLLSFDNSCLDILHLLFGNWHGKGELAITNCLALIYKMKAKIDNDVLNQKLELEYIFRFHALFNQIQSLNNTYGHINSIAVLHSIYKELLSLETLDFKGEPLEGLQIMGMLESRVLDFDTIILTSVNEGILPSGKTNNSFIPFDVKLEHQLPTYKEKDAVYTYHFFRLLQRAKEVYLVYNTEVDALKGGEKSRFIRQLEIEGIHNINHTVVSANVPSIENKLKQISKTASILEQLKILADKGFSPTSLTNYIRNPIDFYYGKILGIKDFETIEETIAANTLGSVIHYTLETFYKPFEGEFLSIEKLVSCKAKIEETITKHFKTLYYKGNFSEGKNLIIYEIAKRYILNFLDLEIKTITKGHSIKIIAIEQSVDTLINIKGIPNSVKLTGNIDRIDQFNGVTRIIDYKSGRVEQNKVEIVNWDDIITDYNLGSKPFQVLCYTYLLYKENKITLPVEAGIISFKNLKSGFLKFSKKDSPYSRVKMQNIDAAILNDFELYLKKLFLEIFNPDIDFIEKEI